MRAILLDNDILIADVWDVNWSQSDGFAFHSDIPIGRGSTSKSSASDASISSASDASISS